MNTATKNKLYATLASFIGIAVFIVLFIFGIIFFSYLLIIGGIIGLVLFGIAYLRTKFFKKQSASMAPNDPHRIHQGRTIDQEE